jgi:glutaredoxin
MPRYRRQNIDRKTNKPELKNSESPRPDLILNRADQVRRDDDVVRTPKRTVYDIDYAIKWFLENEIQPQVEANGELINVPVIFANGEKWDNVRKLGYLRDEKGMLQSPIIVLKRNSLAERDELKKLDVNRPVAGNTLFYKKKYNKRNRYEEELIPIPLTEQKKPSEIYTVNVPEYVDVEYDMLIWTDFTTQMNTLIEQIMPYGTFAWGNEFNKYRTFIRSISFETINTVGEDRLVRCTVPLTVNGTLMAEQEYRQSVVQKRFSIKKLSWAYTISLTDDIFGSTTVPQDILDSQQRIAGGGTVVAENGNGTTVIDGPTLSYLINLTDQTGTFVDTDTITVPEAAAINPVNLTVATKNEFDVYINGQYIDKVLYTWTPLQTSPQTIDFDTSTMGYTLDSQDVIIINGRWD